MKPPVRAFLLAALAACASQQGPQVPPPERQHGVELSDIDRGASPCQDFFEFANGAWREAKSDPGSMAALEPALAGRRDQQGAAPRHPRRGLRSATTGRQGSVEQLIGDFYASCMDEARVDASACNPSQPLLAEIDAIKRPGDLQRAISRGCTTSASPRPSRSARSPTTTSPTQRHRATSSRAASACPTATTTSSRSRASSRRARSTCVHVAGCSSSPARPGDREAGRRRPCSRSRSASPRPRSTTSRCAIRRQPTTRRRSPSCRR